MSRKTIDINSLFEPGTKNHQGPRSWSDHYSDNGKAIDAKLRDGWLMTPRREWIHAGAGRALTTLAAIGIAVTTIIVAAVMIPLTFEPDPANRIFLGILLSLVTAGVPAGLAVAHGSWDTICYRPMRYRFAGQPLADQLDTSAMILSRVTMQNGETHPLIVRRINRALTDLTWVGDAQEDLIMDEYRHELSDETLESLKTQIAESLARVGTETAQIWAEVAAIKSRNEPDNDQVQRLAALQAGLSGSVPTIAWPTAPGMAVGVISPEDGLVPARVDR